MDGQRVAAKPTVDSKTNENILRGIQSLEINDNEEEYAIEITLENEEPTRDASNNLNVAVLDENEIEKHEASRNLKPLVR